MKKLVLLIFLALLVGASASFAAAETTTVMVYMCGSNLESIYGSASKDVTEMLQSGFDTETTNVLIMAGGSREWQLRPFTAEQTIIALAAKKSRGSDGSLKLNVVAELPVMDMGSSESLAYFLNFGAEQYPADRYALIVWDHGGGPVSGVCWDEQFVPNNLSINEMTDALSQSPFQEKPLAWLGFDACLMSTVEVASKIAPFARYMIASQAEEPANGWNYEFLNGLAEDADGGATGTRIIDTYFEALKNSRTDLTMACVDLAAIPEVESAMDRFFDDMSREIDISTFADLAKLRMNATGFGKAVSKSDYSYDLVDVVSLTRSYDTGEASEQVRAAIQKAVFYSRSNIEDSYGLSVYHPFRNQNKFIAQWRDTYTSLDFCPGYTNYVNAYGSIMTGEKLIRWNNLTDLSVSEDGATVSLTLSDEQAANVVSARMIVVAQNLRNTVNDAYCQIYSTNDVALEGNTLTGAYDLKALQMMNASGSFVTTGAISFSETDDGTYLVQLYPIDSEGNQPEKPMIAEYMDDETSNLLRPKRYLVYDEMMQMYTERAVMDLSSYEELYLKREYRQQTKNAYDENVAFDQWTVDDYSTHGYVTDREDFNLSFSHTLTSAELLYAIFEIVDAQGNVYTSERVYVDGGARFYSDFEGSLTGTVPYADAGAYVYWNEKKIILFLDLYNLTDREQFFNLSDVTLNGIRIGSEFATRYGTGSDFVKDTQYKYVVPGDHGVIGIQLSATNIPEAVGDTLHSITGKVTVYNAGSTYFDVDLNVEIDFPLDALFHEDGAKDTVYDDDTILFDTPVWQDDKADFGCIPTVSIQPAESSAGAKLLMNLVFQNNDSRDLYFMLTQTEINGVIIDDMVSTNQDGTGFQYKGRGHRALRQGEQRPAIAQISYDDFAAIKPDTCIQSIKASVCVYEVTENETTCIGEVVLELECDIPLDLFYFPNSTGVPCHQLVSAAQDMDTLTMQNGEVLYDDGECALSVHGWYTNESAQILLLRYENKTAHMMDVSLGQALFMGRPANMGFKISDLAKAHNTQITTYNAGIEPWSTQPSSHVKLAPGEVLYDYVSIAPEDNAIHETPSFSFHLCHNRTETHENAYSSAISMSKREPVRLQNDGWAINCRSDEADFTIVKGERMPDNSFGSRIDPHVSVPENPSAYMRRISLSAPEDEEIEIAAYYLFRELPSDAEMVRQGMMKGDGVSFDAERTWLMYLGQDMMTLSDDGRMAYADVAGLIPHIRAGDQSAPLAFVSPSFTQDGQLSFGRLYTAIGIGLVNYQIYAFMNFFDSIDLVLDLQDGSAALSYQWFFDSSCAAPVDYIETTVCLIPSDADEQTLFDVMGVEYSYEADQGLYIGSSSIAFALEPIENPDGYYVVVGYKTKAGNLVCLPPQPLADFPLIAPVDAGR